MRTLLNQLKRKASLIQVVAAVFKNSGEDLDADAQLLAWRLTGFGGSWREAHWPTLGA